MEITSSCLETDDNKWCLQEEDELCQEGSDKFKFDASKSPTIDVEDTDSPFPLLDPLSHSTDDVDIDSECPLQLLSELDVPAPPLHTKEKKRFRPQAGVEEASGEEGSVDLSSEEVDEDEEMKRIKTKFKQGCDCEDSNCFEYLDPRSVYRHRLNITELTKAEHDMYLMGLIKACISSNQTTRNKERQRLRAHYFYQGRKVCLTAFLFLENVTRYQLKRMRCHLVSHGVTPRVHGNQGKRPHNVFSLETYNQASEFLKKFFEQTNAGSGYGRTPLTISLDHTTRKHIHALYWKELASSSSSEHRLMGYSTFLYFMKHQFPHVKFVKQDSSCKTGKEITREKSVKQNLASVEPSSCTVIQVPTSSEATVIENKQLTQHYQVVIPQSSSQDEMLDSHRLLEPTDSTQLVLSPGESPLEESHTIGSEGQLVFSSANPVASKQFSVPESNTTFIMAPTYTLTNQPLLYIQIQ